MPPQPPPVRCGPAPGSAPPPTPGARAAHRAYGRPSVPAVNAPPGVLPWHPARPNPAAARSSSCPGPTAAPAPPPAPQAEPAQLRTPPSTPRSQRPWPRPPAAAAHWPPATPPPPATSRTHRTQAMIITITRRRSSTNTACRPTTSNPAREWARRDGLLHGRHGAPAPAVHHRTRFPAGARARGDTRVTGTVRRATDPGAWTSPTRYPSALDLARRPEPAWYRPVSGAPQALRHSTLPHPRRKQDAGLPVFVLGTRDVLAQLKHPGSLCIVRRRRLVTPGRAARCCAGPRRISVRSRSAA